MVNVISGSSKTGKSAVIPILDYCLASDRCAIPVGVIRESCSWFGVVIETAEGQKLLARREPGDQQQTSDMYLLEGETVVAPEQIGERNSNTASVKLMLNRVAGLSSLGFDPDSESGFKGKPSFRDLVAFMFQPQNVIANPDVLFFKADTTDHREKLKTIFPYILNAISAADLAARWEIDRIEKILRRKELELNVAHGALNVWKSEAHAWIRHAIDLGLLSANTKISEDWSETLDLLRRIASLDSRKARPSIESLEGPLRRLRELRELEVKAAEEVSENRQRLNEIMRLVQNSGHFGSAIRVQRDRLSLSKWLSGRLNQSGSALAALSSDSLRDLDELLEALSGIEIQLSSHPLISDRLEKEQLRVRGATEKALSDLTRIRGEIFEVERNSASAKKEAYSFDRVERFLGRLQQALTIYERAGENAELRQEISDLKKQISDLRGTVSEGEISRRVGNAISYVEKAISTIVPMLDAEWPDAAVRLLINDLTLKIVRGTRDDFLWEIGSGANWLAYHVATTLALQRFFLELPHHPVPGLLVYDQPSQVYFPRRAAGDLSTHAELRDEDVEAVRKVFVAVASEVTRSSGRLQIIVLDHADEGVWGGLNEVHLVEEWRGKTLVPTEWIVKN